MSTDQETIPGAGKLGMRLLLLSLAILFVATMTGYLFVRSRQEVWPPPGTPGMPAGFWLSTLLILVCSGAVESAFRAARAGKQAALKRGLVLTFVFGAAFLICQAVNWKGLIAAHFTAKVNLYGFLFYFLTGLHAAHVVGGLIPLWIVNQRARAGRYTAAAFAGVEYSRMYWHFLGAIWIVMFAMFLIGG
jgi:heme/copper-type cytochrome/quinol oxidase subunit 3